MQPWDCCRTCLTTESLRPIFAVLEKSENFADAVYLATGIKIEPNDSLPQLVCSKCINFINDVNEFRHHAEYAQKTLLKRLENKEFNNIKEEPPIIKTETYIFLTDSPDNDFHDFDDDDIPLRSLQCDSNLAIKKDVPVEFETIKDIVEEPNKVFEGKKKPFTSKKTKNPKKPVKRKVRSKKENKERERDKSKKKEGEKDEVECEYCHKILTSKLSLRNHYKIHTGFDFVCEHCGKKFITRRLLLMHCRAKHGYEKTDKCSYCDYKASNAEQVKIHERLHTGEKPFVCGECGAGFHRKSSYLQHVAIHLPEKTVQCDQCPARFKSVTLMRIHKNRHRLPSFRFRCALCDNTFARRRNVVRHLTGVHGLNPDPKHIQRLKV